MTQPESLKKQVVKNLASNYAMTGIGMVFGILLVPFMIFKLGKASFGLVSMVESLVLLYELVTVSVRQALSRYATFALSAGREDEFVEYLSTGRVLLFVSSAIVLFVGILVTIYFPTLFRVPAGQENAARWLFFFMTFAFAASIPNAVFWSVLYAKQRFDLINSATSVAIVVRAAMLFTWFSVAPARWAGLEAYGFIYCVVMLTDNAVVYLWHRRIMPGLRLSMEHFRRARVREIVSYSFHTSLGRLSNVLVGNIIQVCINVFWGPAMNAVFAVSQKIPNYLRRIFVEPIWTLTPTFTKLAAEKDHDRIERLLFSFSKAVSIVTIPVCLFFILFSGPVIRLWIGPGFDTSAQLMKIYLFPMIFGMQLTVANCLPSAYGKVKIPSLVGAGLAIFGSVAGFVLAVPFRMGLFGFAWSSFVIGLVSVTCFSSTYACRISGISVRRFFGETVVWPFLTALVLWGGLFGSWTFFFHENLHLSAFAAASVVVAGAYAWICARYILTARERGLVLDVVRRATGFAR